MADLYEAHENVGDQFTYHQFERAYRRGYQQFQVAPFALSHQGHGGEQHQGHGQDDRGEPRYDIDLRAPFRIEEQGHLEAGIAGEVGVPGGAITSRQAADLPLSPTRGPI